MDYLALASLIPGFAAGRFSRSPLSPISPSFAFVVLQPIAFSALHFRFLLGRLHVPGLRRPALVPFVRNDGPESTMRLLVPLRRRGDAGRRDMAVD